MRLSLRLRIGLFFAACVLGTIGYVTLFWEPRLSRQSEEILTRTTRSHLSTVAEGLVPLLLDRRLASIHEYLAATLAGNRDWLSMTLWDARGQRIFPLAASITVASPDHRRFALDVAFRNQALGRLELVVDFGAELQTMRRENQDSAAALVAGLLFALFAFVLFVEFAVRGPIRRLAHAANRVAEGEFDTALPTARGDEVGDLITSFATMRDAIRQQQAEILSAQEALEDRVRERTGELRAANAALRESETVKATILDSALDCIVTINTEGRVIEWNEAAERTLGYSRDSAIGSRMVELIVPQATRAAHEKGFRRYLETGVGTVLGKRMELTALRADGSEFPAELAITARKSGELHIITGYLRDVTEVKQAEERLRQAQRMEAVGQLTGGVAHDFNNLLAVIQGNAELLMDSVGHDNPLAQAILRSGRRGAELTQRLLAFSRRQPLRPQLTDLAELIGGTRDLLARTLGATIEVEVEAAPDLWPASADSGQVENVLLNLAINARDAMPEGGRLTITCSNARLDKADLADNPEAIAGDYVMLTVSDTGSGMTQEVLERAFEPFFTTKDVGKGSGLGLSMVYGFAKQSGGHVTISSASGTGTAVKLYLPRAAPNQKAEKAQPEDGAPRGHGERVLVVEDDPEVRSLVVRVLESLGYRVSDVPEATSAQRLLEQECIDLVLSDVVLPGGTSGTDFAKVLRARYPNIKIVFMSGYSAEAAVDDSFLSEGVVRLNKPFNKRALAKALREALDREAPVPQ